mmetsp:Transcript_5768/g.22789  ORF Transcript_5768/g.22789 Transcript_5768/m.22789 type:complete len:219 (+) Transcript_5768:149-805(+)
MTDGGRCRAGAPSAGSRRRLRWVARTRVRQQTNARRPVPRKAASSQVRTACVRGRRACGRLSSSASCCAWSRARVGPCPASWVSSRPSSRPLGFCRGGCTICSSGRLRRLRPTGWRVAAARARHRRRAARRLRLDLSRRSWSAPSRCARAAGQVKRRRRRTPSRTLFRGSFPERKLPPTRGPWPGRTPQRLSSYGRAPLRQHEAQTARVHDNYHRRAA